MSDTDISRLKIERGATPRPTKRSPLWPYVLACGVAAATALGYYFASAEREVQLLAVTSAYPYEADVQLNAAGYVVAQRKAAVATKATGRLVWLGVTEGSHVKAGEVIARLEDRDVAAQAAQADAGVAQAHSNLAQALAERDVAALALTRTKDLAARRFISGAALDDATARFRRAEAGWQAAKAALEVARANARYAHVEVDQTEIRAPFTGVVLTKSADVGDVITPMSQATDSKGAVVTMADLATLEVEADVSESNLSRIQVGQPCEIQLDAFPQARLRGEVSRMVPTVDRAKATVLVKVRFIDTEPAPGAAILPDMSARVAFLSRAIPETDRQPLITVHRDALVRRNAQDVVFLFGDGRVRQVAVTVGQAIGDLIAVTGVKVGDRVVLQPPTVLGDGDPVKISGPA